MKSERSVEKLTHAHSESKAHSGSRLNFFGFEATGHGMAVVLNLPSVTVCLQADFFLEHSFPCADF